MIRRLLVLAVIVAAGVYVVRRIAARRALQPAAESGTGGAAGRGEAPAPEETARERGVSRPVARVLAEAAEVARRAAERAREALPLGRERGVEEPQGQARPEAGAPAATPATAVEPAPLIKGSVRDGERVYLLPGDPGYETAPADHWFASTEEAEAAGFRRAPTPEA